MKKRFGSLKTYANLKGTTRSYLFKEKGEPNKSIFPAAKYMMP